MAEYEQPMPVHCGQHVSDGAQPTNMTLLPPFLLIASLTASGALSRGYLAPAVSTVALLWAGH